MPIEVKASFQNIEEYEIKVETTMNYAQWKLLVANIDRKYMQPIASFIEPIEAAIRELETKVLIKEKPAPVDDGKVIKNP